MERVMGRRTGLAIGLIVLALAPVRLAAAGENSCAVDLGISYLLPLSAGATARVHISLGAGSIHGGTQAAIRAVRFALQCSSRSSRAVPCSSDGSVVAYAGDETITTTCLGVTWSTRHGVSPRPNQVVFEPDSPLSIPANTPDFCYLEFDITALGLSRDATPDVVEQVASIGFGRDEASCDNGLKAATAVGGGLGL